MSVGFKNIVSIQSWVASGYVGGNVAALAIQLHGFDPISLPTVMLSSHTGLDIVLGETTASDLFKKLLKGVSLNGVLNETRYLVTGYCNSEELLQTTAAFVNTLKKQKDRFVFLYDPVFGDFRTDGLYVSDAVAQTSIKKLLPICDILTPNHFELQYILQKNINTASELIEAIANQAILQSKTLIVTSIVLKDTPSNKIEVIIVKDGKMERLQAPKISVDVVGTGDLFMAIVAAQLNMGNNLSQAVRCAMRFISATLLYIQGNNGEELYAEALVKHMPMLYE